jgi:hypothetical protein
MDKQNEKKEKSTYFEFYPNAINPEGVWVWVWVKMDGCGWSGCG